ncbi:MAG: hypothetical protein QOJ41_626 [Acidobacteriaceae bacterium]|nr:hypothetical protein [Acidobacteriaceae bacterium]
MDNQPARFSSLQYRREPPFRFIIGSVVRIHSVGMHDARYPSKVASGFQMKIANLRVPSFSRLACGFGFASALSCAVLPLEDP